MEYDEVYEHFIDLGIFTLIEGGIISGQLRDEYEGVYWIETLIKHFEDLEEYEKCHKLNTMLQVYIKVMQLEK
jgi:hypothetical protein